MFSTIEIICVGKYKDKNLESLEHHYLKQTKKLKIRELKSFSEDVGREQAEIENSLAKYDPNQVHLLTELGKEFKNSVDFSHFLETQSARIGKPLIFVISGAIGFSDEMKQKYQSLSVSPLTLPHKLCRLILVEQIYRAQTILTGHPYHN